MTTTTCCSLRLGHGPRLLSTFLLLPALLLCLLRCSCTTAQDSSGCSDLQETADLCMEGSGSGDIGYELPWDEESGAGVGATAICRSSRLATWYPDSAAGVQTAYRMVQSCRKFPKDGNSWSNCESVDQHVPVHEMDTVLPVTSLSSNLTYFNRYCFLCSGDPGPEVTWSVNVSCSRWVDLQSLGSEHDVLRAAVNSPYCWIVLQPPADVTVHTCHDGYPGGFPRTPAPPVKTRPTQLPGRTSPAGNSIIAHSVGAPLSLLLNFREPRATPGGDSNKGSKPTKTVSCSEDDFFLRSENRCLPIRCEAGKRLVDRKCQSVIQRARGLSYSLTLTLDAFVTLRDVRQDHPMAALTSQCSLEEVLKSGVIHKMPLLHSDAYSLSARVVKDRSLSISPSFHVLLTADNDLYFAESDDLQTVKNASLAKTLDMKGDDGKGDSFFWGTLVVWIDFVVTQEVEREEVETTALRISSQDWHVTCGETHARLVPTLSRRPYASDPGAVISNSSLRDKRLFWENVPKSEYRHYLTQSDRTTLTVSPFLLCPFVVFSPEDYEVQDSETSAANVSVFNVSASLSDSNYRVDEDGMLVLCRDTFVHHFLIHLTSDTSGTTNRTQSQTREESLLVTIERYLSLACVSLSLVGLLATVLTYSFFRSLRTIPGKNAMGLCVNLFFAQALLQFGIRQTQHEGVCMVIGMLVHYAWLATLLWMNVCSFHMRRVFSAKLYASRMTSEHLRCCSRRLAGYTLYAQGVPAFIVGATAATSILLSEGRQVGYGGDVCYLASPLLVGVAFVLPLCLVVVLNMAFFLQAVRAIARDAPVPHHRGGGGAAAMHEQNGGRATGRGSPKVVPSSWRRNLNVCVRLSTLTGLFWTLGLLAEVFDVPILRLVSVVVNGSQGVLIAASYILTRRVARLYRHACCTCCVGHRRTLAVSQPASASASGSANSTPASSGSNTVSTNFSSSSHPQTSRL